MRTCYRIQMAQQWTVQREDGTTLDRVQILQSNLADIFRKDAKMTSKFNGKFNRSASLADHQLTSIMLVM